MKKHLFSCGFFLFIFLFSGAIAFATEPAEQILKGIEDVRLILKAEKSDEQKRTEIFAIVEAMFDFTETSKRALALKWKQLSVAEQDIFVQGFSRKLFDVYYAKVAGSADGYEVVLGGQRVSGLRAEVETKILRNKLEIPVIYVMKRDDSGCWRVYDVVIEGVSMVSNYRVQFNALTQQRIFEILEKNTNT